MSFDVAIIGGGIMGMMTAYELCKADLKVAIIDKGQLGQQASSAAGGIISALPPWKQSQAALQLESWSQSQFPLLCEEIESSVNLSCDYFRCGMLVAEMELDQTFTTWQQKTENVICVEQFDELASSQCLKSLSNMVWLPDIAQVDNVKLVVALKQYLIQLGVEIFENEPVSYLEQFNSQLISKVHTSQQEIIADKYVIAAGAWSGDNKLNTEIEIKPIRGQMISYKLDEPLLKFIVLTNGKYCIPRKDKRLIIGSTLEDVGFDLSTEDSAKHDLISFAEDLIPALKKSEPEQHWSGLRPKLDRELPIISKHKQLENVYINTGHYRNGITNAPASARLMRNLILNESPIVEASNFA